MEQEIMNVNNELINEVAEATTEEVVNTTAKQPISGWKIAGGVALTVLGVTWAYKRLIKPGIAKLKAKMEAKKQKKANGCNCGCGQPDDEFITPDFEIEE